MAGLFREAGGGAEPVPGEEGVQVVRLDVGTGRTGWIESGDFEDLRHEIKAKSNVDRSI